MDVGQAPPEEAAAGFGEAEHHYLELESGQAIGAITPTLAKNATGYFKSHDLTCPTPQFTRAPRYSTSRSTVPLVLP